MSEKEIRRKVIASIHALVFIAIAIIFALVSQFSSFGWFAINNEVKAGALTISADTPDTFLELNYYRVSSTALYTEHDEKHNIYYFSYDSSALNFTLEDENGNAVRERSDFSTPVPMLEHSDLSANSQVLIRIKVKNAGTYAIDLNTDTTNYLGDIFEEMTENGTYNISPNGLPLSSVVRFAILTSSEINDDETERMFSLTDSDIELITNTFVTFKEGDASFELPFDTKTFTVEDDGYIYIFVDYYLPAIEDIIEKAMLYVDAATKNNSAYNEIEVGHTNLKFDLDFEFSVREVE